MSCDLCVLKQPNTDFASNPLFMGISWDYNLWAMTPLILWYQRSFFQQVRALGESVFIDDLTWKGKVRFMAPHTNTEGENLQNGNVEVALQFEGMWT